MTAPDNCPQCGRFLKGAMCPACDAEPSPSESGKRCEVCDRSMKSRGSYNVTVPWEDGDDAEGYMTCPHCRHRNIMWGVWG